MTKFLISIVEPEWDPAAVTEEEWASTGRLHNAFAEGVRAAGGQVLSGEALQPAKAGFRLDPLLKDPTTAPLDDTETVVTGFYLIELPDDADAAAVISRCPTDGHLDVRPIMELPD